MRTRPGPPDCKRRHHGTGDEIDWMAKKIIQKEIQIDVPVEGGRPPKLHQDVHVAIWPGLVPGSGPEDGEALNPPISTSSSLGASSLWRISDRLRRSDASGAEAWNPQKRIEAGEDRSCGVRKTPVRGLLGFDPPIFVPSRGRN